MTLTLDRDDTKAMENLKNAIESGDSTLFAKEIYQNMLDNNNEIQERILNEAKTFNIQNADSAVMAQRGFAPLTAEETKYYNAVADAHSFQGLELPKTVFERVFEDLRKNHPLLSKIVFQNVTGVTEWVIRVGEVEAAWWGPLCEEIKKKLDGSFETISTNLLKVSAYIPICKAMLDLGPQWLDRYVREILAESIALAMEQGIIAGTGNNQPVGMIKQLANVVDGNHADKTPVALTDLSPTTIGTQILAPLRAGKVNPMGEIVLVVNEAAYYSKLYQFEVTQDENGIYHTQNLPFNGTIIPSPYVPENQMVVGEAKNYFMGIGSELKIDYSDEFRFLDDQRVYIAKQYANGRPRQDQDFIVFDIANLEVVPTTPQA